MIRRVNRVDSETWPLQKAPQRVVCQTKKASVQGAPLRSVRITGLLYVDVHEVRAVNSYMNCVDLADSVLRRTWLPIHSGSASDASDALNLNRDPFGAPFRASSWSDACW